MDDGASTAIPDKARQGFLAARWHGQVPLSRLLWWDVAVIGTLVNVATTFAALALLAMKGSTAAALAVHFSALPYNLFLLLAVWRTAEKTTPATAWLVQLGATAWLLLVVII